MDTIGKRLRLAMVNKDYKQVDVLRLLEQAGTTISRSQLSKITTDGAMMFTPALLIALSDALDINLHYLITGKEPEAKEEKFFSNEANAVGALVDAMLPASRQLMQIIAENIAAQDRQRRLQDRALTRLLEDVSDHLTNGQRKLAAEYIDSIAHHI